MMNYEGLLKLALAQAELFAEQSKWQEANLTRDLVAAVERLEARVREVEEHRDRWRDSCEASKAELRQLRGNLLAGHEVSRVDVLYSLEGVFSDLAGDGPEPGFGTNPADSAALLKLRCCIDDQACFPDEETEHAGDYEAAVRHMGQLARERACLFSETRTLDVRGEFGIDWLPRFVGHHVRFTAEALYPIGEPTEASKPEGMEP